ncbi:hypothetical protein H7X65_01845 [Candidatus Parcubacteria bacterium]|nr:hypothetical protein [Candidatus Parcubacteria bacterium]
MKSLLKFIAVMLGIADIAAAQAPEQLSVGNSAVVENLAKLQTITITCWALTAQAPSVQTLGGLQNLNSTTDIISLLNTINVRLRLKDPLDNVYVTGSLKDAGGNELFVSNQQFNLVRVYDSVTGKPRWETPYYAGNLYFLMQTTRIYVGGATTVYMLHRNGDMYMLNVTNGWIEIEGYMNSYWSAYFKELVIGDYRYDMNTGSLLHSENAAPVFRNVQFANLEKVDLDNQNTATLYTSPYWGNIPNFEVGATGKRFKVIVIDNQNDWSTPIAIHVATLADLRPGGKGYKSYPYHKGIELEVVPGNSYYIKLEYQNSEIGGGIARPTTPTTPGGSTGGGGTPQG